MMYPLIYNMHFALGSINLICLFIFYYFAITKIQLMKQLKIGLVIMILLSIYLFWENRYNYLLFYLSKLTNTNQYQNKLQSNNYLNFFFR